MKPRRRTARAATAVLALSLVTALLATAPATASSEEVTVADFSFTPKNVSLPIAGVVTWTYDGSGFAHSVHQVKGLFDSGDPTSDPFTYTRTFSAGSFSYRCEVHSSMTGKVSVPVSIFRGEEALPTVTWAADGTNTGTKFDVQYRVGDNAWKTWRSDTTDLEATFGLGGDPVTLKIGKTYRIRARSQKRADTSAWSPARKYVHD